MQDVLVHFHAKCIGILPLALIRSMRKEKTRVLFVCHHGVRSSNHATQFAELVKKSGLSDRIEVDDAHKFFRDPHDFKQKVISSDHVVVEQPLMLQEVEEVVRETRANTTVHAGGSLRFRHGENWLEALLKIIHPGSP